MHVLTEFVHLNINATHGERGMGSCRNRDISKIYGGH